MAKRRLIQLLPGFQQTTDLTNFFGATVDEVFQPGISEALSGYIGRVPSFFDPATDFYIGEPTTSRAAYQLEAGMISEDSTGAIDNTLSYPDFVGYLSTEGSFVNDHQRLFETEYYSWAPPINIDMLTNFRDYYWFGDENSLADLDSITLTLTVPMNFYTGDGSTTTFGLPSGINAVAPADEDPQVFVNDIPVPFTISGTNVICTTAPGVGTTILVCRTPSLAAAIIGQTTVDISDLNTHNVALLSSTMRIKIIDATHIIGAWDAQPWDFNLWDAGGTNIYMVDGVGLSIRLTPDDIIIRDLIAQYITIDRSSLDFNLWSLHNSWIHKDVYKWTNLDFPERQAIRPIIEFIRDIVLYPGQIWSESTSPKFMLYDVDNVALNDPGRYPGSNFAGSRIFGYDVGTGPIDPVILQPLAFDQNGYILFSNDAFAIQYNYDGTPITSHYCYATNPACRVIGSISGTTLSVVFVLSGVITLGQTVSGVGITDTIITAFGTGDGGVGTYTIDVSQNANIISVVTSATASSGSNTLTFVSTSGISVGDYIISPGVPLGTWVGSVTPTQVGLSGFTTTTATINSGDSVGFISQQVITLSDLSYSSLWHPAATTTTQAVVNGFYTVPLNLQANPLSDDVTLISRSTWIDHFKSIISNQAGIIGTALGDNNYRDTARDLSLGIDILQHRAPMLKAMLTAADDNYDIPQAVRFADSEYNRFRNKFARRLVIINNNGTLASVDPTVLPDVWVVEALNEIKRDRTINFPFALNTIGGGQYFIPPTPTALGVLPAAVPAMITDSTYATPVLMIRGHDGSLTPAFNDWRDDVMLALEQRIYDHLPTQFQTEARPVFDIYNWIGGRFFAPYNGYTQQELNQILGPMFELWAQVNKFDYRTNSTYDPNNPFTWNYNGVADRFGNILPGGNWRAIYRWYYGTDAPHERPWEMLGFIYKPTWWTGVYGTDFSKNNAALWVDLENGTIRGGPREGADDRYSRPGLSELIPVDYLGNLLNPIQAGIININITLQVGSRSWVTGDQGPAENLWINSPSYRYAIALAAFLMKPARFMEECWDTIDIGYVGPQWVEFSTLYRPLDSKQYVHGEILPSGATAVVTGVQQWIADYLVSSGQNSSGFGTDVRNLDVRLIHQMAGFISSEEIKAVADNFGLLPSEDVQVVLYNSPTTDTEVYSGVILEWTGRSWRVIGYDPRSPAFTIIPPDVNGSKGIISLAQAAEPSIVPWNPSTYYPLNILVVYQNSVFQCIRGHTSGSQFENTFWKSRPDLSTNMIRAPRVVTYNRGLNGTQSIPYGTEFVNYQDVANFLLGWERYLVSRGWIFEGTDPNTGLNLDWSLAVREFLTWAQIQWQPGNFIALSPGQLSLNFSIPNGTILNVEDNITGFFGLIDRSGQPIRQRDAHISRLDGTMTISATNADIFCARLEIAEIEHALVFSNITIFDDDVYLPLFNMRQGRLRLICNRSVDWAGRLDAPGFIILGNQLASDFEKAANDVRFMFDIEKADVLNLRSYARHNIGFQERDYLNNLLLSDTEQFEFYQGMIQQKGAPGVFAKLMRSVRASSDSNLEFLEEWAFRLGQYGAPVDPFITFQITQDSYRNDPQIIRFKTMANAPLSWITMPLSDSRWFDKPASQFFFTLNTAYVNPVLPSAGPVRLTDVVNTVFNLTDVIALYTTIFQAGTTTPFATGSRTWVYVRPDGTYTVLESFEIGTVPNPILKVTTVAEDPTVTTSRIYFQNQINVTTADVGDYLVIDGQSFSNPDLQGIQTITVVNVVDNYIEVEQVGTAGYDFTPTPLSAPFVRILREVRFATIHDLNNVTYAWTVGDLVWIDNVAAGLWAVMQWNGSSWDTVRNQPHRVNPTTISETVLYYETVRIDTASQQMIVNEPAIPVLDVIDPLAGLLAGISEREIDFQTPYDPARYNSGAATVANNPWGNDQVGRVWFNTSTVRFLEPFTDILGASSARDLAELTNRVSAWSQVAPSSSVDVYEWIKSTVPPDVYNQPSSFVADTQTSFSTGQTQTNTLYPGTVYNADEPAWVQDTEFDPVTGAEIIYYFFWVSGLTTFPNVPFRKTDVSSVALGIQNPSGAGLQWLAPISADSLIVSGIQPELNDLNSVLKIRLTMDTDNPGRHDEWILLRPTDETTLPTDPQWINLKNSLATFDINLKPIPSPNLAPQRATGVLAGQSMFVLNGPGGTRAGINDARQAFVGSINNIFAATPIMIDRESYIETITRPNPVLPNQYLIWTEPDTSFAYEQPPGDEWDVEVFTLDHRNQIVARQDFLDAVSEGRTIRVLLSSIGNPQGHRGWSIWNFNPVTAAAVIAANPSLTPAVALLKNATTVFDLAPTYEWEVSSKAARNALIQPVPTINIGDRVLVTNDGDAMGFWTIWKYVNNTGNPANDFILWNMQRYRTSDFFAPVNWYATGFSPNNPPIVTYQNALARNNTEGPNPTNLFVLIQDDGTPNHYWEWTQFQNGEWVTVANENGTIALSSQFYNPANTFNLFSFGRSAVLNLGSVSGNILYFNTTIGITVGMTVNSPGIIPGTVVTAVDDVSAAISTTAGVTVTPGQLVTFTNANVPNIANVVTRDGSWELCILVQALRYGGILLDTEINKNWFDIINFIHSQQADVDWAFKTSFMTIVGYNVPLEETPYVVPDQTDNLVEYVKEVKPYHVKIREFSTQYNTDPDIANVTVTDFDKPVYLDPATNTYRVLDPIADAAILATLPWSYWYNNYLTNPNLIRGLDITLVFDRYVALTETWDSTPWDSVSWDDSEDFSSDVYVHTFISVSLTTTGEVISVDDIRFLLDKAPFTINLNGHSYSINAVNIDDVNISVTEHGTSGTLVSNTNVLVADATIGNVVEAVILMPSAALRIIDYYEPTADMPPKDLVLLMDLDYGASTIVYQTTIDVPIGGTVLTFASTMGVPDLQPIVGPNIIKGTYGAIVTATTVTLSHPTVGVIPAGTNITFHLPNWIDGFILQNFVPPISEFDILPFDEEQFDTDTNLYDTTYDGSTLSAPVPTVSINAPLTSSPDGFGLREPYFTPGHPQERVPFTADDGLQMIITADADAGGPPQIIKSFDVSALPGPTATLFFDLIARSATDIMVFRDGMRAIYNTDYTVDHLGRNVTVTITGTRIVSIHAYGFGGLSPVNEQHFIGYSTNPIVLDAASTTADVMVVEAGVELTGGSDFTVSGANVTLASPPGGGTDMVVVVYEGGTSGAVRMTTQNLSYNIGQTWTLNPHDADTIPEHAGTIVEVNGQRLAPLTTWYGTFSLEQPWMFLPIPPINTTTVTVYVDGVLYGTAIPFATGTNPSSPYPFKITGFTPPPLVAGQFVFFENLMIALDPTFVSDNVVVVLEFAGVPPDYVVIGGSLTINPTLSPSDKIVVTTFSNADSMDFQTVVYPESYAGELFVPTPFAKDYALVSMNGLELSPDFDYEIDLEALGWDSIPFDSNPYDIGELISVLNIFPPIDGTIVAMMTTGQAAREQMTWLVMTNTPAFIRMPPANDSHGHQLVGSPIHGTPLFSLATTADLSEGHILTFASTSQIKPKQFVIGEGIAPGTQVTLVTSTTIEINKDVIGPISIGDTVSFFKPELQYRVRYQYVRQTPYMAGSLTQPLAPTDTSIHVLLFLKELSPKLQDANPLPQPTSKRPGSVWINGERIEYFGYSRSGNDVILTGLRRETMGTTIGEQRVVATATGTGSSQVLILDASNGSGTVEVVVDGLQITPVDYTLTTVGSTIHVTLTTTVGAYVTAAMTYGYSYATGSAVYNGQQTFVPAVPIGIPVGNREIQPMHRIIAG